MKLLSLLSSPTSCHFISLRSKYSPQHPTMLGGSLITMAWSVLRLRMEDTASRYGYDWEGIE
jgi:hypothetical protein